MIEIRDALATKGLSFETFEGKENDFLELNFETYQVSLFNSQIAVSLPYWDVNTSPAIENEIKTISRVLIERGYSGYDPQTGKIFSDPTTLSTNFPQVLKKVNEQLLTKVGKGKSREGWRLIKPGLIFIFVFLLVKMMASLIGSLF